MTDEGNIKSLRTSKEQIDCYLSFVNAKPSMKLNKNNPTNPKRMDELWEELAGRLNALKGPTRSASKWKECLSHWKNQVRSRARKAKAHRMVTGGGPSLEESDNLEQRALETLGSVVVEGISGVPTIGTDIEVMESEIFLDSPSPSSPIDESSGDDIQPSPARGRMNGTNIIMEKLLKSINDRNEEERNYRRESMANIKSVGDSINNVASALKDLAAAIALNFQKLTCQNVLVLC